MLNSSVLPIDVDTVIAEKKETESKSYFDLRNDYKQQLAVIPDEPKDPIQWRNRIELMGKVGHYHWLDAMHMTNDESEFEYSHVLEINNAIDNFEVIVFTLMNITIDAWVSEQLNINRYRLFLCHRQLLLFYLMRGDWTLVDVNIRKIFNTLKTPDQRFEPTEAEYIATSLLELLDRFMVNQQAIRALLLIKAIRALTQFTELPLLKAETSAYQALNIPTIDIDITDEAAKNSTSSTEQAAEPLLMQQHRAKAIDCFLNKVALDYLHIRSSEDDKLAIFSNMDSLNENVLKEVNSQVKKCMWHIINCGGQTAANLQCYRFFQDLAIYYLLKLASCCAVQTHLNNAVKSRMLDYYSQFHALCIAREAEFSDSYATKNYYYRLLTLKFIYQFALVLHDRGIDLMTKNQ
jgi:hypothetical protein